MKKKIKDLTFVEIARICEEYNNEDEGECPLYDCCLCTPPYCWIGDDSRAETEVDIPKEDLK